MSAQDLSPAWLAGDTEQRTRLLQGMGRALAARGLANTTIADVVREAGMSKRSFYEHFPNKEACFLALYAAAHGAALRTLKEAVQPDRPWLDQLEVAFEAYFSHLASGHLLLKVLFVDIHLLGPSGAVVRRGALDALTQFMCDTVNGPRRQTSAGPSISPDLALAAIGGINEWIMRSIERDEAASLPQMAPVACALVRALVPPAEG
ncbi:TetR/AcrR family transcriptional regulator [Hydrogenophaga sp. PAMC20947]|uniref:TetR/AcrR family transcriptional regulator n=1 Tax=Hydrogenophaga sp. PAMC20947 TaxID=2565558 RepID=UPI00109DD545|nr:TetR/AcrR family transcriptional regulator [Hydrogenophaga sp. PAMC20947]QCB45630.1 TetR/AcrR family transcriptional regulator [Hydrogenophaga sp. PAMC20947]